ncbi:MAG: hypothetical protein ABI128_08155 [Rhodanobacter sp.]
MKPRFLWLVSAAWMLGTTCACSSSAPSGPADGKPKPVGSGAASRNTGTWTSHGSSACQEFITPEFASQLFDNANGTSSRLSDWSCSFDTPDGKSINVVLIDASAGTFDSDPNVQGATPAHGIGDKAVRTASGVEAYKAQRGICQIDVMPPFGLKLQSEQLTNKLGELCNKLFALP